MFYMIMNGVAAMVFCVATFTHRQTTESIIYAALCCIFSQLAEFSWKSAHARLASARPERSEDARGSDQSGKDSK